MSTRSVQSNRLACAFHQNATGWDAGFDHHCEDCMLKTDVLEPGDVDAYGRRYVCGYDVCPPNCPELDYENDRATVALGPNWDFTLDELGEAPF